MGRARTLLIGAMAALTWPATGWSQAPAAPARLDLIASLETICVAAAGDRAKAVELATEAGFSPTPAEMIPFMRGATNTAGYMRSNEADMAFVMLGTLTRRLGRRDVTMEFCGVSSRPTDHRALDRRLRETMGFAPVQGGGFDAYAWVQTPEGRSAASALTDQHFTAMAETGQMRMVALDRSGTGSTLIYFLPRFD